MSNDSKPPSLLSGCILDETLFSAVLVAVGIIVVAGVVVLFGPVTGLKAAYGLVGVSLAGVVLSLRPVDSLDGHITAGGTTRIQQPPIAAMAKLGLAVLLFSFGMSFAVGSRLVLLLVGVPVMVVALLRQIRRNASAATVVPQALILFVTPPLSKYLMVDVYFGNGDIIGHLVEIEHLFRAGGTGAIGGPYQFFPGLHVLVGTVAETTGISVYDATMLVGIPVMACAVLLVYGIVKRLTSDQQYVNATVLAVSGLPVVSFYSTYFFPQSMGVLLMLVLLYVAYRTDNLGRSGRRRFVAVSLVATAALVFSHHFTLLLFVPIVVTLVGYQEIQRRLARTTSRRQVRVFQLTVTSVGALSYWLLYDLFIGQLFWAVQNTLLGGQTVASDETSGIPIETLGTTLSRHSPVEAVVSLGSPSGIHAIAFVVVVVLGVYWFLRGKMPTGTGPPVAVGILGLVLVLESPLVVTQRIGFPFAFFIAFLVGAAIVYVLRGAERSRLGTVLVTVLLISSPLVAADDIYVLSSGPDLKELYNGKEPQREFTQAEWDGLQRGATFVGGYEGDATSMWMTSVALQRFGTGTSGDIWVADGAIRTSSDVLVYRTRWAEHQVYYNGSASRVSFSQTYLDQMVAHQNQIYTTGAVGMLWEPTDREFGNSST